MKKRVADRCDLQDGDIIQLTQYYACMVRQIGEFSKDQYVDKAQAVLEHHFDCHDHCGTFCKRKSESEEERKKSGKVYRCKTKDAKLYDALKIILAPFITKEALIEVAHGWDTNANESMNNTISWLAPKNKSYSGTVSLRNRVCMAIGIQSLGYDQYFARLFRELGLDLDDTTKHRLAQNEKQRKYRKEQTKLANNKRKRKQATYVKIANYFEKLKKDRAAGKEYKTGVSMELTNANVGEEAAIVKVKTATKRKKSPKETNISELVQCRFCGIYGHDSVENEDCIAPTPNSTAGI
jgi:hypothetical protein